MPWSLEEQLILLGPTLFEEICGQIVLGDDRSAQHLFGKGGDEGIDIRAGELDPALRAATGATLTIWQVKFFRDGIKDSQKKKIAESFRRALKHQPDRWVLCVPRPLTVGEAEWWDEFKVSAAREYPRLKVDVWPGDVLINRMTEALRGPYFLPPAMVRGDALGRIERRLNDFYPVSEALARAKEANQQHPKSPAAFYGGTQADWRDIDREFDAPRSAMGQIWRFLAQRTESAGEGRIPFVLLTGRSGDGKSTLLLRIGAELLRHNAGSVLIQKDDHATLEVDEIEESQDQPVILLVDSLTRFSEDTLHALFVRLQRSGLRAVVVGCAMRSIWTAMTLELHDLADIHEARLEKLEDFEIDGLLDKLEAWSTGERNWLGSLAGKGRAQQRKAFRKADRQLLVALLEVQGGEGLEAHVRNELDQLSRRSNGNVVRRAVLFVSSLHRFDLRMPVALLRRLLPGCDIELDIIPLTEGLLLLTESEGAIRTRHALIAETLWRAETRQEDMYERLLDAASAEDQRLVGQVIKNLNRIGPEYYLGLVEKAADAFPANSILLNNYAIALRDRGQTVRARFVFAKAYDQDPNSVPNLSAWAILERDTGNAGSVNAEFSARWLFRKAYDQDPNSVPTLSAWAILERDTGNAGSVNAEFSARWLFRTAYDHDPNNVPNLSAWAILERDRGNAGSVAVEFSARWLFGEALKIHPKNAAVWQDLATLEERENNPGSPTAPAPMTARYAFEKGCEASPGDATIRTAFAGFEKRQGNIERSVRLLEQAAGLETNRRSRCRAYFDAATLLRRDRQWDRAHSLYVLAVEADPKDWRAKAALAGSLGYRGEWDLAEHHFSLSLSLKKDLRTEQWRNRMRAARQRALAAGR
ncbi:MAG: hypothetical protein ABSG65_25750 [Bryobacteraceae bacterium]